MALYKATFTKYETYIIEADSIDEASDKAWERLDADIFAFTDPVDKVEIVEVNNNEIED